MRLFFLFALTISTLLTHVHAGAPMKEEKTIVAEESPFDKGKLELQSSSGAFLSIGSFGPTLNYSFTSYRLGVMLNTPTGDGCLRGNFEFLVEAFGGSVFNGPGNGLGGLAVLLRYNFVQPDSKLVPYIQLGGGGVYSDIYKNQNQRLIGEAFEFDLEATLGLRYFISEHWALNLEGGFRHISNADLASRNIGLNSLGASLGLGYHF